MKIAILSNGNANYSTQRLVAEAELRGHSVRVIKYKNCYLSLDELHSDVYYRGKKLEGYDAIIPRISNNMTRYGCAIVRQLEMQGAWTASSSIAITRARDKLRSQQILAKAGVNTPKTLVSRNTADIDELLDQIGLPVIIKLASGTHGNGVVLAETKKLPNPLFRLSISITKTVRTSCFRNMSRNPPALIFAPLSLVRVSWPA